MKSSKKQRHKLRYKVFFTLIVIVAISVFSVYNYTKIALREQIKNYPMEYADIVEKYSSLYGVDEPVIYATILCESNFDSGAVSPKGAMGLMQLTPDTFEWLCTKTGEDIQSLDILDPEVNIRYGTYFLAMLYEEFGAADIVHAAYNAGRSRVRGWLKSEEYFKDGKLYNIPFKETRSYVEKIKRATQKYYNILEVQK